MPKPRGLRSRVRGAAGRVAVLAVCGLAAPMLPEDLMERWSSSVRDAQQIYDAAGVAWALIDRTAAP